MIIFLSKLNIILFFCIFIKINTESSKSKDTLKILTIDIGGTNIKVKVNNDAERRKIPSGNYMTPEMMVSLVIEATNDWEFEVISIGFPGVIKKGKIVTEPKNLGDGWLGFDFEKAFGKPVKLINDASMQALGSYQGDTMLFLGLGTG